jgi:hypothetical protein
MYVAYHESTHETIHESTHETIHEITHETKHARDLTMHACMYVLRVYVLRVRGGVGCEQDVHSLLLLDEVPPGALGPVDHDPHQPRSAPAMSHARP